MIECVAIEFFQNAGYTWPFPFTETEMRQGLANEVCDVSQSIQRGPVKKLGTLTTSTHLYFFAHDLALPPKFYHLISGYPRTLSWDVKGGATVKVARPNREKKKEGRPRDTSAFVREVIGKGYSLPECALAHYSLFLCREAPWWKRLCY